MGKVYFIKNFNIRILFNTDLIIPYGIILDLEK